MLPRYEPTKDHKLFPLYPICETSGAISAFVLLNCGHHTACNIATPRPDSSTTDVILLHCSNTQYGEASARSLLS